MLSVIENLALKLIQSEFQTVSFQKYTGIDTGSTITNSRNSGGKILKKDCTKKKNFRTHLKKYTLTIPSTLYLNIDSLPLLPHNDRIPFQIGHVDHFPFLHHQGMGG